MNPKYSLDEGLESLGSMLRGQPPLTDRVMREVRQSVPEGLTKKTAEDVSAGKVRRRWPFVTTTMAVMIVFAVMALITFPQGSVGWEEINRAVGDQKWIRASATYLDGQRGTIWVSPEQKIWAYQNEDRLEFSDGKKKLTYDYKTDGKKISKRRLSETDGQRFAPIDFRRDDMILSHWLFGERIVEQHRREVAEGEKSWIEFQLVLQRGELKHATLRIDPLTKLPVFIRLSSPTDATKAMKWEFDYPAMGPNDVYALGAPRNAEIDDHTPSTDAEKVLDGMAASRAKIDDFQLDVFTSPGFQLYRVWRKGAQWRIDLLLPEKIVGAIAEPAEGTDLADWFETQIAQSNQFPLFLCDGKVVYQQSWPNYSSNAVGSGWRPSSQFTPDDLLSASGARGLPGHVNFIARVFPDRFGNRGWKYEFDPRPTIAPGCVAYKLSAKIATLEPQTAHEWYYIDSSKGYAVVQAELFNLPVDAPANLDAAQIRTSIVMKDFLRSPDGFSYPTVIRETSKGPNSSDQTTFYRFNFEVSLPESLFTISKDPDSVEPSNK